MQQTGASQMSAKRLSRSWLLLIPVFLLLGLGWAINRSSLEQALKDEQRHVDKLTTVVESMKRQLVQVMLVPSQKERSIDAYTCRMLADDIYLQEPGGDDARAIWTAVLETSKESRLTGYHFHFDNWGDDPDGDMPRDVHIFADQSGNFIAVGVEQGIVSGAKNSRPFLSICEDAKWRLMKL
jgi:hypothetical protein